ncbi:2Fe-2S iron-sulfur cluster-binding protein [Streptomyces sp. NPDC085900]|uniref:2Fe-2S iron-sulfur cluster-binding protein n=1 Tax=Streptomyces gilvifuscus TaxID=1550617 RepID=A0ABT5FYP0_9ACTN|nr:MULTISPECIES: 2Fe-2S iron-sulfur cluster-binding protein [Streptomyces]MBK3641177.1 2Fe-2S iron-sulfur cluster binding domain-containing protein [Streptomyces sp. MBT33]MDC2957565.1 2Fe-2S iron-sulfur cluster-binding protein [Streptomyces gilvifuscus]
MPKITYVAADRSEQTLDLPVGTTVMRGALSNDIDGIVGQCGGYTQCASCHVYVDQDSAAALDPVGPEEDEMLEFTACPREPNSRLSCQLKVGEDLDGLRVLLPERQG